MLNDLNFEIRVNDVSANTGGLLVTLTLYAPWPKGVRKGESTLPTDHRCPQCGWWYSGKDENCPVCAASSQEVTNDCPF
jgi:hypothetical protein